MDKIMSALPFKLDFDSKRAVGDRFYFFSLYPKGKNISLPWIIFKRWEKGSKRIYMGEGVAA